MAQNIKEILDLAMAIDGAIGVSLVDYKSGMALGSSGGGALLNLEVASAGNTEVVRSKMRVMERLGLKDHIEDILITLGQQFHVIRVSQSKPGLFLYLALSREKSNLALARMKLQELDDKLSV